jgi:vacuolar-type H+-ATPase subunit I/STV1
VTTPTDAYWDEWGVAWCAINPDINVITPRLKSRLRRQSFFIVASLVLGFLFAATGFLVGIVTIWRGWSTSTWNFVTRGIAIVAIAGILSMAASLLLPFRASDNARALSEMIDLAIARAERTLITIRLGFYACAVAAVLGLAGTVIRAYLTRPPRMSPVIDLAVLAIFALGLFLYARHVRVNLAKFKCLKQALATVAE